MRILGISTNQKMKHFSHLYGKLQFNYIFTNILNYLVTYILGMINSLLYENILSNYESKNFVIRNFCEYELNTRDHRNIDTEVIYF